MDMNLSKLEERVKDREAWRAAVHGVTKSRRWLSDWRATRGFLSGPWLGKPQSPLCPSPSWRRGIFSSLLPIRSGKTEAVFTAPFLLEELTQSCDPANSHEIHFWVYQMALTSLGRGETFMKQVHRKANLICCYNFPWFLKATLKRGRPWFHWGLYAHPENARERDKGDRGLLAELSLKPHYI